MEFRTVVPVSPSFSPIGYQRPVMLFGSCFTEYIGGRFLSAKLPADVNPFGIQYNPLSMARAIDMLLAGKRFVPDDLFQESRLWHSYMHHSSFSHFDVNECLKKINERLDRASAGIKTADWLIVTWGTSYVYRLNGTGEVVSNCHKQPASLFIRERVSPDGIVEEWRSFVDELHRQNPGLKILFTVSPVRHLKDGAHENQLSKAGLLLAADTLCRIYPDFCCYFPAYEIVMDELRDYRFFADDMAHPSSLAVSYIWERFSSVFFEEETRQVIREWEKLSKALLHRPLTPDIIAYKDFVMQNLFKLKKFSEKYPYFAVLNEIHSLENLLKTL